MQPCHCVVVVVVVVEDVLQRRLSAVTGGRPWPPTAMLANKPYERNRKVYRDRVLVGRDVVERGFLGDHVVSVHLLRHVVLAHC